MENEYLKIFDEDRNYIGTATREEVHKMGFWHEVMHCWFITKEENEDYIYLQLRSHLKKDYPNLFDITAAGHLLAHETIQDGVREIKEELGIEVAFNELTPLGVIDYCIKRESFIDKELANVFLYICNNSFEDFTLQEEEVAGIVKVKFTDFAALWLNKTENIRAEGFEINKDGYKSFINRVVGREEFVPHQMSYYTKVIQKIKGTLAQLQ